MKIDTTIGLIFVISFSTIFFPIVTTILNRKYDLAFKKIEFKRETLQTNHSQTLQTFQEFILATGKILTRIDSSQTPSRIEIQDFETACLKCLLFLNEEDRKTFQTFRILVKIRFGHKDPRGTNNFSFFNSIQLVKDSMFAAHGIVQEDKVYSKFNECITIATKYLETFEIQEKELLTEQKAPSKLLHRIQLHSQRKDKNKKQ